VNFPAEAAHARLPRRLKQSHLNGLAVNPALRALRLTGGNAEESIVVDGFVAVSARRSVEGGARSVVHAVPSFKALLMEGACVTGGFRNTVADAL